MSIATELSDYETYLKNAYDKCEEKEATIPNKKTLQNLTSTIESIKDNVKVYTVTFDSDGGTEVASQQIVSGYTAKEPESPTKAEYIFTGWLLNGEYFDFETPITENITLVAKWHQQQVNYQMLYDGSLGEAGANGANVCKDVTGGYAFMLSNDNATVEYKNSYIYMNSVSQYSNSAVMTNNSIDLAEYKFLCAYALPQTSGVIVNGANVRDIKGFGAAGTSGSKALGTSTSNSIVSTNSANLQNSSYIDKKFLYDIDISSVSSGYPYFSNYSDLNGYSKSTIYSMFLMKEDNWQELCTKAGLTSSNYTDEATLCANSTAISTILNNKETVEYMIYNCTGTFMYYFIRNSDCLTALNNSAYKTTVQANEHWNKFLNMVA